MVGVNDIQKVTDNILEDNKEVTIHIPLEDLVWTIVSFSYMMRYNEDEAFLNPNISSEERQHYINHREYLASRRDELARLIGQYSEFDTQRIWTVIRESGIFRSYK